MFDIMLLSYQLAVRVRVRINQALATALSLARPNRGRGLLSVSLAEASSFEERAGDGRGDGGLHSAMSVSLADASSPEERAAGGRRGFTKISGVSENKRFRVSLKPQCIGRRA